MSYYWIYYAAMLFAGVAQKNPYFALGILAFFAFRPWLPDPVVIWKNLGRIGSLKRQAELNPANITVRRDLGYAYIELRWWRSALRYLDEARARFPRDQELQYLRGLALLGKRDYEDALRAFGEAVGIDPDRGEPFSSTNADKMFRRYGEAYLGAAKSLIALDRLEQAEEALEICIPYNTSTLEPILLLAKVRSNRGNEKGAQEARALARKTYRELPGFMRRRQIGFWLRSFL